VVATTSECGYNKAGLENSYTISGASVTKQNTIPDSSTHYVVPLQPKLTMSIQ